MRVLKELALYVVLFLLLLLIVSRVFGGTEKVTKLRFDQFRTKVKAGEVQSVRINTTTGRIDGFLKVEGNPKGNPFWTSGPTTLDDTYEELLATTKVKTEYYQQSDTWWSAILPWVALFILFIVGWFFLINQMQNSGNKAMAFGKSRARLYTEEKARITFDDVAGEDEAKEELAEIVEFLKQPRKFTELGARIPKGVLLVGAPGTGKTLLARAVAGEAGAPFLNISGSDFVEMFVGVGASRVRDLFEQAKKNAPCIVFVDEIDAVGRQRGAGLGGGHDEREQTLNQLLVEMDGFEPNSGIIILAATNRPDVLDPALLRPGRFDRQVTLDIPDIKGREDILKVHAKGKPLASDVALSVLARRTPGFTGADLANTLNEAALLAARRGLKEVGMAECEEAIERVIAGPERRSRVMSENERQLTAYHEAGHALVGYFLPTVDPIHKVSIIPRGQMGGYTLALPMEDKHYATRTELQEDVIMFLGGRAAESIALHEISTGARNDLDRATRLVRKMVTEFGMSEELGHMTFGHGQEEQIFLGRDIARDRNYSEEVAAAIDREMRHIMDDSYQKAEKLIEDNRHLLDAVAKALLENETLEAEEFQRLMEGQTPA